MTLSHKAPIHRVGAETAYLIFPFFQIPCGDTVFLLLLYYSTNKGGGGEGDLKANRYQKTAHKSYCTEM